MIERKGWMKVMERVMSVVELEYGKNWEMEKSKEMTYVRDDGKLHRDPSS